MLNSEKEPEVMKEQLETQLKEQVEKQLEQQPKAQLEELEELTEERMAEIHHHHHPQGPGMKEMKGGVRPEDKDALENWNSLSR